MIRRRRIQRERIAMKDVMKIKVRAFEPGVRGVPLTADIEKTLFSQYRTRTTSLFGL